MSYRLAWPRFLSVAAITATALGLAAHPLGAQTTKSCSTDDDDDDYDKKKCSVDVTVSLTTERTTWVYVSTSNVGFPQIGTNELAAKFVNTPGPMSEVRANTTWQLLISPGSLTWKGPTTRADKPSEDFQWSTDSDPALKPLSGSTRVRGGSAGRDFTDYFRYRMVLDWSKDPPGDYSITVKYTVVSP